MLSKGFAFVRDDINGFVTSFPSNLGTGMRASVHMKHPNTTIDGTDTRLREVCRLLEVVALNFCCVPQFNVKRKRTFQTALLIIITTNCKFDNFQLKIRAELIRYLHGVNLKSVLVSSKHLLYQLKI